jgi:hypothetical protein
MLTFKRLSRIAAFVAASVLVMAGTMAPALTEAASQPRDCEANSIMWCGAYTKGEFDNKLRNGDGHNNAANLQKIYLHEGRGFTQSAFDSGSTVDGTVFKDGRVVVNGKVGGTGARTIGRDFMTGSVKSGGVWERPTSTSFASDSIPAWVNMSGGTMHWFVVKSCGNMGRGTAVAQTPAPVKPTLAPTPLRTTTPLSFSCVSISVTQPDKVNKPNRFRFTVTPNTSGGVAVSGSRFDFSDIGTVDSPTVSIDRDLNAGSSIKVDGHVKTTAGITATTAACSTSVTVQGQVLSATTASTPALPATGAETALGGAAGLTAIGFATRSYMRSKKNLLGALRGFGRRDM